MFLFNILISILSFIAIIAVIYFVIRLIRRSNFWHNTFHYNPRNNNEYRYDKSGPKNRNHNYRDDEDFWDED